MRGVNAANVIAAMREQRGPFENSPSKKCSNDESTCRCMWSTGFLKIKKEGKIPLFQILEVKA